MVKLVVDWNPVPLLDIGVGATWRKTDYKELYYGRNDDKRQIYDASIAYGDPDRFRVSAIGNWGKTEFHQAYRNMASGASPLPGGTQTATTFDWGTKNTQDNWLVALQADWAASDKLAVTAQASWLNTGGGVDFQSGNTTGAGGYNGGPLVNYETDDTDTTRFLIKATYKVNKTWSATAGYAYEKYDYSDGQMAGYQSYYPYYQYIPGNNNAAVVQQQLEHRRLRQPELQEQHLLVDRDVQLRHATAAAGKDAGRGSATGAGRRTAAAAAAPPAPAPAPAPAPQVQKITLDSKVLFDFDKAVLKPEGMAAIDSQVVGKLAQVQKLEVVLVTGHTDRLGTDAYNQKLSEKRADAVRNYLVSKGVDKAKVETIGMGEKQPVVQCDQKDMKALIACLQPNRRVEVQVKGEAKK